MADVQSEAEIKTGMQKQFEAGHVWSGMVVRHLKRGGTYEVIASEAILEGDRTPNLRMVVYREVNRGVVWIRPRSEFVDGRFVIA